MTVLLLQLSLQKSRHCFILYVNLLGLISLCSVSRLIRVFFEGLSRP